MLLRAGALPATLTVIEERTVGPGLGQDSIHAGKIAGIIGCILVVAFMFVAYGFLGFLANIALAVHVAMIIAAAVAARRDADLAGHRRHRADHRHGGRFQRADLRAHPRGATKRPLGDPGDRHRLHASALATIVDSNVTTLIATVVLFYLGTGPVKGFAVTFAIGIVTTVFTAFTFTRLLVVDLAAPARPKELPRAPVTFVPPGTKIPFMGIRRWTFTLSSAAVDRCRSCCS